MGSDDDTTTGEEMGDVTNGTEGEWPGGRHDEGEAERTLRLFDSDGERAARRDEAVRAIAVRAHSRRSGARGLRAIIEQVMLEVMYEVPSVEGVSEVVITEDVVNGTGEPIYTAAKEYGVPG